MADTKISALSALTGANLASTDEFAVVDKSDTTMGASGTDKRMTADELAIGIGNLLRIASASTTLTNHTPNNATAEQWATEVATIAQADCPSAAVVIASLDGWLSPNTGGSPAAGNRGAAGLEVSFDGGSSWSSMGPEQNVSMPMVDSVARDFPFGLRRRATGTVTGDVKVRATCRDGDGANKTTFEGGYILAQVHPQ